MFIVGLTGGISTGKSTVLSIFRENGVAVIDADQVARKVLEPGTRAWREVRNHFGDEVLWPNGKMNRVKLGEIIFSNKKKRTKLNSITHPKIQHEMMKMALKCFISGHSYIIMEVPLLFETGRMLAFMHKVITVVCDDDQQLERLRNRNEVTEARAIQRIKCQMPLDQKIAMSDFVIDNSGDIEDTREQTEDIIRVLNMSKFTWYFRIVSFFAFFSILIGLTHLTIALYKK
ncbi:dephospho-CoA kinase domain-containing protein [Leptidea sinapis]|uniref:dephospho-CoA kinase domain-containing protein n=1 Tax=Leptidea sinapis TaxID=189913 RepID=UPI002129A5F1|nr:dephospho-CoA kinase domain-containing protein [Leptidea sinapis]XP_050683777.1 dephospho-CoA kinase domain-containing protein [Leptidea sinapis]XP_050683778.1 dephospho-CoA kinase domain-containing protein [Leptidea sinapis]